MKELIYKLVDAISMGRGLSKSINGIKMRLPTRYINYFPSDYEKENFDFLRSVVRAGDTILDIGAHIGVFSVYAAKLTGPRGRVFAFEPTPQTNGLLEQTIRMNKVQAITQSRSEAVGAEQGHTKFYISDFNVDNSNSLVSYKNDRALHGIDITVTTVDGFVHENRLDKVAFIKIDVEGAEMDALKGAIHTLKDKRPYCILALHPDGIKAKGDELAGIYDLVEQLDYRAYYKKELISKTAFCDQQDLFDVHLVPAELKLP